MLLKKPDPKNFRLFIRLSEVNGQWVMDQMNASNYKYITAFIDDLITMMRENEEVIGKAIEGVINSETGDKIRKKSR